MKKAIIALALAGIAASASAFFDDHGNWIGDGAGYFYVEIPGVTVIGNPIPPGNNICAPFVCIEILPSGGGGGGGGGGPGGVPQPPPPTAPAPPPSPPPTKQACVDQCALDRKIRNNECTRESALLYNRLESKAIAAERAKLSQSVLKMMLLAGEVPDIPGYVLSQIEREQKAFDTFCAGVAATAENACLSNCTAKFGWFLPMLLVRRRREDPEEVFKG